MSGEVNTGTIIGFLRLDGSDWMKTVAECKAAAEALGKSDPDVHIKTNAKQVATEVKVADAAVRDLDRSHQKASKSAGMLVTALIGLGPALIPLGGFIAGTALALGGMGAAGVLAVVQVKKEMEEGTELGQAYSGAIATAKDSMTALGREAAKGILQPFLRVVDELHSKTPALAGQMGRLGTLLGTSLGPSVTGLVTLFQRFNPLLEQVGNYATLAGVAFDKWANSGDLSGFMSYVMGVMPQVVALFRELFPAIGNIIAAFAPFGGTVVSALTAFSAAINAIPTPVLATLATFGIAAFAGFKTFGLISGIVDGVAGALVRMGVASDTASAALTRLKSAAGWIGAIVTIATMAWTAFESKQQETRAAVEGLTQALVASGGAVDASIRQMMVKKLADDGVLESAEKLGLNLGLVTDAMLGQADAAATLRDQLEAHYVRGGALGGFRKELAVVNYALTTNSGNMAEATRAAAAMREAGDAASGSLTAQGSALAVQAGFLGTTTVALQAAKDGQDKQAAATAAATVQMQLQNNAAGLLKAALDALSGKALSAAQTQNSFEQSQLGVTNAVKNGSTAMEGNSAAATANRGALLQAVTAAQAAASAYGEEMQSTAAARDKAIEMKNAIIENAAAQGMNTAEVQAFIDKVFQIPASVPPTQVDANTAAAEAKLTELSRARYATIYVTTVGGRIDDGSGGYANRGQFGNADGGLYGLSGGHVVRAFRDGGFADRIGSQSSQIANAGGRGIQWAEDGAGNWEGFVSGHPGKRPRSMTIAEEVVRRLGGTVQWSGEGKAPTAPTQGRDIDYAALAGAFTTAMEGMGIRITGTNKVHNEWAAEMATAIGRA